ncbi:unnamed protein product [Linum trigynum]|uniref:CHHC U11-48K-type domain-containing protein n=1 Tax=Linum trigynum TaxID=586398 RepID=A0AAV2EA56_9ROSI
MNPSSAPPPNHLHFPYPRPNPNPTPTIYFHPLHRPPPPPSWQSPPPPRPLLAPPLQSQYPTVAVPVATPVRDVSAALSSLTDLVSLARRTLGSVSTLIDSDPSPEKPNEELVPCPYNRHHLIPAESLFVHSLRCPSPVCEDPTSLIQFLHYPKTLNYQFPVKTLFDESSEQHKKGELCLSLESYYREFRSNFFYEDCPSAVNFRELENSGKMVTVPSVLSVECADFVGITEASNQVFYEKMFRILSSESWAIRRDVEGWVDYPTQYSYGIFCAVLRLNVVKMNDLGRWIISNSPRFGSVIDKYMRDHISVLSVLCLKAIRKEALALVGTDISIANLSFPCPNSVQALKWLASQLSLLYGELNAKSFTIYIFKQCILVAAKEAVLFCLNPDLKGISTDLDENGSENMKYVQFGEPLEGCSDQEKDKKAKFNAEEDNIGISQVAAAVAALHERSLLEAKIKALQSSQLQPSYQRAIEHTYVSARAAEERKKRPNYQAIIEHDGFRKRSSNQETSRPKTKEELLAEERDYKRRRISYRGKKIKRTTLEVMRDIIDDCMEEIKQAGGIGCFEKPVEEECVPSGYLHDPKVVSVDIGGGHPKISEESSKVVRETIDHHQRQSNYQHKQRPTSTSEYPLYKDMEPRKNRDHGKRVRDCRSPERQRNRDNAQESSGAKHHHIRSSKSNSRIDQSLSIDGSYSSNIPHLLNKKHKVSDKGDSDRRNSYSRHRSSNHEAPGFEDRYDPTRSP